MTQLTHLDADGRARMVDVSGKAATAREAVAAGLVRMSAATRDLALSGGARKGDVIAVAEIAGVMAAKKTSDLIPLCHPLSLSKVEVRITRADAGLEVTARVATNGPTVRPTWYLWEDGAFWILSGPWAKLLSRVHADPAVALVVDVCDTTTGLTRQVIARGDAEVVPFDVPRGRRKLYRYLGDDESRWDSRFRDYLYSDTSQLGTVWICLRPKSLTASDLSYEV